MLIKEVIYINKNLYKFSFYINVHNFEINKDNNNFINLKLFNMFLLGSSVLLNIFKVFFIIINLINLLNWYLKSFKIY